MNEREFVIWLKGFSENVPKAPTQAQWDKIRHELALVFNKVTPFRLGNGEANIPGPRRDIVRDSKAAINLFPERDCISEIKYC